jgi:uncharacterized protein YhjY with autotransporter beta-barrel domain
MKRIVFSRKALLRAIHATALALYFAAVSAAHAQTATGDGNGNITISGTGNTAFVLGPTSTPPLASGGTLTISSTTNDTVGGSSSTVSAYVIQVTTPSTTTNSGYLSASNSNNFSGGPAATLDISPLTTSGNVTIQNNSAGTITASSYMGTATAVDIENVQQGSISITNSGQISAAPLSNGQASTVTGIFANDTYAQGSITLVNTGTISLTGSSSNGYGAMLSTSGSGGITVTNSGTINENTTDGESVAGDGLDLTSSGSGAITVNNNGGTITGSSNYGNGIGINATSSGSGAVTITNTGTVTGSNSNYNRNGFGIDVTASGSGNITITNSGPVTGNASSTASAIYVTDTGTGLLTVSNSGALTSSGYTSSGIAANDTGDVSITNTAGGTIVSNGHFGSGINATSASGNASVNNSAAITVNGMFSSTAIQISGATASLINSGALTSQGRDDTTALGINATSTVGALMVTNSGAITASGNYIPAADILLQGTGNTSLITTGSQILSATAHYNGNVNATGESVTSTAGTVTINNQQTLQINGDLGDGIVGSSQLGTSIANSGMVSVSGYYLTYGVRAIAATGNASATNTLTGTISSTSTYGTAYGIYAQSQSGSAQVGNAGTIDATSTNGSATVISVVSAPSGLVTNSVTNSGTLSSNAQGSAIGILMTNGVDTLTNSGAISATGQSGATGIDVVSSGDALITNSGASIQATSTTGTASAIYIYTPNGTGTVMNSGALTSTNGGNAYGIYAQSQNGNTASYNITNSAAIHATTTSSSGYYFACGIYVYGGDPVQITNQGAITVTGTGSHDYGTGIVAHGGDVSISNFAPLDVTTSGGASEGIYGTSAYSLSINNTAAISVTSASGYVQGIVAFSSSPSTSIDNSGSITASGAGLDYGIDGYTIGANLSITNSGGVTVTSSANSASGLYASAANGSITLTNSGHVSATSQSGAYTASGIYSKAGSGTTTINNSGYAGGFNTNGGLGYGIDVDPTGPIVVNNTGTAIGTTTGIYLQNAGTVNNYGLASGGTYSIQVPTGSTVNLEGASPVLGLLKGGANASSTSTLNFDIVIRGNNYNTEKMSLDDAIAAYGIAYAAAGGVGNVDSSVVVLNGIDYQWEDFLHIADNLIQGRLYAATPGYEGLGNAVDNFDTGSTRGTAILAALDNLPDSGVSNALAQLSPKALQVFRNIAFDGASFTAANVNNHLANLRDGLTGFDTSGFSVNAPGVDPMLTEMRSHLLAFNPAPSDGLLSDSASPLLGAFDPKDTKALVNTQPIDPWSAFISGSVILANLDNTTSNIGDSDYTTGSILAGVDYRLDDHFTVGALFNYAHTSATLDGNGSKATVDSYAPGIYGSYVDKGWYGNAMLMYGFNNNTDDRQVSIPGLSGDNHGASDGGQVTSNFTGGYEFQRGPFKFGPVASLQYVHLTVGSFQEQGPTSLSIDRQEADSLRTQLGFEARYSVNVPTCYGPLAVTPHLQASWQHEYMDNSDGISSQFNGGAGGGSFVVQGQQPERDSAFLDLGLDAQVAKNVTVFVDYQTQAGQNDFFAQSAQGGVRIGF